MLTPVVRAQIDGIHVVTVNATGEDRSIDVEDIGGDNAPMGTSETVWAIEPGAARVRCFDTDLDAGLDIGWVELTIVDPAGSFHPTALDCTDQTAMSIDYVPEAAGASDDPIALTLGLVADDDPTYEVEAAGYAQEDSRQVRVRDGGRAIALARWSSTGSGGWLLMSVTTCADVRIDWVP